MLNYKPCMAISSPRGVWSERRLAKGSLVFFVIPLLLPPPPVKSPPPLPLADSNASLHSVPSPNTCIYNPFPKKVHDTFNRGGGGGTGHAASPSKTPQFT